MQINNQSLKVLIVDDSERDASQIINELEKNGYHPVYQRVDNSFTMKKAVREKQWAIVLCDYDMPEFNAFSAIAVLKEENIDIPVIILSETIGEDVAADCMRTGAKDFIMKNNFSRLCPAIARELKNEEIKRKQKQAESQREAVLEELHQIIIERNREETKFKQTIESLRKAIDASMQVVVSVVETREPFTQGHQLRATNLAYAIANDMGLDQVQKDGIRMAGAVYDIGKLSVPAEILSKSSKLTNIEISLIKEHSRSGYEMLKNVESSWPLAEIVYQHHERMNGSGYPRNLKGDEILMESRVLAVSDVVESMVSRRSYRPALDFDVALEEIEKNKGILYDSAVVNSCVKIFRDGMRM
ncbi:MAG: response regulator [Deltaproteobacteria bacterium]|nr:response regulator [Deltaproteobacteria bacterium]